MTFYVQYIYHIYTVCIYIYRVNKTHHLFLTSPTLHKWRSDVAAEYECIETSLSRSGKTQLISRRLPLRIKLCGTVAVLTHGGEELLMVSHNKYR